MERIADGLQLLRGTPRHAFNVYLADGYVVDAATRWARRRIIRQLAGERLAGHVITHAHADHQGASAALARELGLPILAGHADADAIASGDLRDRAPVNPLTRWQLRNWAGPAAPVATRLREGDRVGSFTVLETPGHAPGLISLWRESDRTLIAADVLFGQHPVTSRPGLHEPPARFTLDPALNRTQIRRLAALEPAVVCFGHGPPSRDPTALTRFAAGLPD
ncbi:MBL fold metallo-hydrolase [Conexibacter sp. JD483]|uniref:MBL fold metallo-hydrolase n=1 Tax=unclassified Conexibacter TaxID=2627773 RepID=UPI00272269B8|nr:MULTISPECIES: MBL fold metallo-hydrolase [unclassified Conexibacter]MDO8185655.1 MBL fold metallo-hydrolase [Conexibacter sp. CPCC 205706]MDO8198828.1 MBL fold metallo-hydrolase [Conexibacter sp. CPCC 205762]MDR9367822.1 MBL fold metallo-hydrolase [Conexibacter sp. JD483]